MSDFEEKFKHLNFNHNDNKNFNDDRKKNITDNEKNMAIEAIFKELIKNISEKTENDRLFVLMLMTMLKSKKTSNELILALLYIFM